MATDFREKEREFIDSLEADTGRDLEGWMAAISASGLTERNAIIDFLRREGFLFARASWLERIHHNGGRPIYAGGSSVPAVDRTQLRRPRLTVAAQQQPPSGAASAGHEAREAAAAIAPVALVPELSPAPPAAVTPFAPVMQSPAADPGAAAPALDALLQEAKAYKPLALYVLREIGAAVPGLSATPAAGFIALESPDLFAVLTISSRELRLGLASPGQAPGAPFVPARFPKTHAHVPPAISHAVVLTDARQITPGLIAEVKAAASRRA